MENTPRYTLLYLILTPVILIPAALITFLVIRGNEAEQYYKRALNSAAAGNYQAAAAEFTRAGSLGHAESYYSLACIYRSGVISADNADELIRINLERAALNGSIQAEFELGKLAEDHPEPDYAQAAMHYRRAALDGHAKAQLAMARFYEYGLGVNKSPLLAKEFYLYAAQQDNLEAHTALGLLYISGKLGKCDFASARKHLQVAVKAGNPQAYTAMGYVCEHSQPENEESQQLAGVYYRRAANAGDVQGTVNYGDWLMKQQRESEALNIYMQAAEKLNSPAAMHRLGVYYFKKNNPDYQRARQFFERAAASGNAGSWINLGIMAEIGHGCPVDLKRAGECYSMAEKLGHPEAVKRLQELK